MPFYIIFWCVLAAAVTGPLLAQFASYRSPKQPVDVDVDAERRLLKEVLADSTQVAVAREVAETCREQFTSPYRQELWDLAEKQADFSTSELSASVAAELVQVNAAGPIDDYDAAMVAEYAEWRKIYQGAGKVEQDSETFIMSRVYCKPSRSRFMTASAWMAVMGFFSILLPYQTLSGMELVAAFVTLAIVSGAGYAIAAIDHDTLNVDYYTLLVFGFAAYLSAGWQIYLAGDSFARMLLGPGLAVTWVTVLTVTNYGFRKLRGIDGIGGGDWKIIALTASVPAVVFDSFYLGFMAVIGAFALALAVRVPLLVFKKVDRMTRFALGPYLALGWPIGWLIAHLQGAV